MGSQPPNTQPNYYTHSRLQFLLHFSIADDDQLQVSCAKTTSSSVMPSQAQTRSGPSSNVAMPLPPDPKPIFELNQARRAKVTRELEALRRGEYFIIPNVRENRISRRDAHASSSLSSSTYHPSLTQIPPFLQHSSSGQPWRDWKRSSRRRSSTAKCWKI